MLNKDIKEWCSCVRNMERIEAWEKDFEWHDENPSPREGDLVLVKVLQNGKSYNHLENRYGRDVRLYPEDKIVCILGTRKSGTKLSGSFPRTRLKKGMQLELLSLGGIAGESFCIPSYFGSEALLLQIEGFPFLNGSVLNIGVVNAAEAINIDPIDDMYGKTIWIGGTSAESGKTTLVCKGISTLKNYNSGFRVSAIKLVGTGRLSDMLCYKDAGAAFVSDYVDEGWPSTYNISVEDFDRVTGNLLRRSNAASDLAFIEIGGDLLAGCAEESLRFAAKSAYPFFLVVNDAMGAIAGLEILRAAGIENVRICTMKQNSYSLSERLGRFALDITDSEKVTAEFKNYKYVTVSRQLN